MAAWRLDSLVSVFMFYNKNGIAMVTYDDVWWINPLSDNNIMSV